MDDTAERAAFHRTQRRVADLFAPTGGPRTVIVVPSLSMDSTSLGKIPGIGHYEERLLFLLQLLRDPHTRVVYVTSSAIAPEVLDYALDLVPSMPRSHARARLTMLDCGNTDPIPLTAKILQRPGLLARLRGFAGQDGVLVPFTSSALERTLAVRLGVPLYAPDPDLAELGSKTGSRSLFRAAGVPIAEGVEGLRDFGDLVGALAHLRERDPTTARAIIKLNYSFGAGGNVLFSFAGAPLTGLESWLRKELPRRAVFATPPDEWDRYVGQVEVMGAVVERLMEGDEVTSPSAQMLMSTTGEVRVLTTHDQVLDGQIFAGCAFPARTEYRLEIQELALRAAHALAARSVVGISSIDFVSVRTGATWRHYALELNLRMGGGTAPYFLLHGLVEGAYDPETGRYLTQDGSPRAYFATDRLYRTEYSALSPSDVLDTLVRERFHYHSGSRTGTVGYMLGALEIGRFGVVSIDRDVAAAERRHDDLVRAFDARVSRIAQTG
ncbi:hypothetical protein [Actinokineospora globicatena]|uniref:ATP-grasp domain-containing protein n=1 Tax=Actinokineospora globicatena TaxID=103729 RepID=A0A9W6V7F3_9PSEU|nr:hypothetical protein [Actinokineospora globicatena]GLW91307.1 hypothetical protein Aglo03_21230 [Actinokineospora globicatena]